MTTTTPPASTPRVDKLRADRDASGVRRRELYATDAEWGQIKALAEKLAAKRKRAR